MLSYLSVFLTGFLFVCFFYVGLPFGFSADYIDFVHTSRAFSLGQFLALTFNPTTPGWFFMDGLGMAHLRPVQYLLFKLHYQLFGAGSISFEIEEAIACGLLSCLIFFIILKGSRSKLYGWLGVLLYLSFPTNFFSINLFLTPVYLMSLMALAAFVIFGYLTLTPPKSRMKFILGIFSWYFLVLILIKLKSAEKLLPPIFITFLVMQGKGIAHRLGRGKYVLLFLVSLFMMVSVVPYHFLIGDHLKLSPSSSIEQPGGINEKRPSSARKEQSIRSFSWTNAYRKLFQDTEGEPPFTTLLKKKIPQSFSESLGLTLSWVFWILLILSFYMISFIRKKSDKHEDKERLEFLCHFFHLFFLWALFVSIGFIGKFTSTNIAYLNYLFVPAVPLFFIMIAIFEKAIFKRSYLS